MSTDIDLVQDADTFVKANTFDDIKNASWYDRDQNLVSVAEFNFTYNYTPALQAAGLTSLREFFDMPGAQVAEKVEQVLDALKANSQYGDLIRGDGTWGTYDLLVERLTALLTACKKHPDARLTVA